jgi:hypothetical protein
MKKGIFNFKFISSAAIDLFNNIFPNDIIPDNDIPNIAKGLVHKLNTEQQSELISNLLQIKNKEIEDTQNHLKRLSKDRVYLKISMEQSFKELIPMLEGV